MIARPPNCPRCGAFMRHDAYYARWTCPRDWCPGVREIPRPQHDGRPSPPLGRLLADLPPEPEGEGD